MTDMEYLNLALSKMHNGQWFGFSGKEQSYSTLIVHDSSITKPTEAEVNAKIQEIKDAETQKANDKISAQNKLKALGLTDDEIEALQG
jgi:hypothetical protein